MAQDQPLFETAMAAARGPASYFEGTEPDDGLGGAIALTMGALFFWSVLWGARRSVGVFVVPLVRGSDAFETVGSTFGVSPPVAAAMAIGGLVLSSVFAGMLVGGVLYAFVTVSTHAAGRWLLGTESFALTAEAVATAVGVFALAGWLPYVVSLVAVYAGYVGVVGLRERHGLSTEQAVAMGSPLLLTVALVVLVSLPL